MKIKSFGKLVDGRSAGLYILRNSSGSEAHVTNYGATLVRLIVPGKDGMMRDVVLGHDDTCRTHVHQIFVFTDIPAESPGCSDASRICPEEICFGILLEC